MSIEKTKLGERKVVSFEQIAREKGLMESGMALQKIEFISTVNLNFVPQRNNSTANIRIQHMYVRSGLRPY